MAQSPALANITMEVFEDLDDKDYDNFDTLVSTLNPFLTATTNALTQRLTFSQNFDAKYKTVTVTVPDEVWTTATLDNGWSAFSSSVVPAYRITESGRVYLRGWAAGGTTTPGTAMFNLPTGFRPTQAQLFSVAVSDAFGRIDIPTNGNVQFTVGVGSTYVSFDGVTFDSVASGPASAPAAYDGPDWPISLLPEVQGDVVDVRLVQATDLAGQSNLSLGGFGCDWAMNDQGNVIVKRIGGLSPGRKYRLTFLILGQ